MWDEKKIEKHKIACKLLNKIKNSAFEHIRRNKNISEHEVQQFIIAEFKKLGLKNEKDKPIVAFNEDSAIPHFYPKRKSKKLKKETLILIDMWARLNEKYAPFSDITWMAYYGKVPARIKNVFNAVVKARDSALRFIRSELKAGRMPIGREINHITKKMLIEAGFKKNILHSTGHCIGFISPHGRHSHLNSKNSNCLHKNLGYTIEPGIYFKRKFGIRSEINFYINRNKKLIITTPIQRKITRI
jgi:Xaa-Pro aminopeptidase